MKNQIRDPVKITARGTVIVGSGKAHRWRLNVPPSITGTKKQRLFFATEKEAKAKRDELLANRQGLSTGQLDALKARGMTVEDAVTYAITHAPIVTDVTLAKLLDQYAHHREKEVGVGSRYQATLDSYVKKIKGTFGEKNLRDVTTVQIRAFLGNLKNRSGTGPASKDSRNHYIESKRPLGDLLGGG